jgi:putative oxidoreductase
MKLQCPITGTCILSEKKCDAIIDIARWKLLMTKRWLTPTFDLAVRLWMAEIFWKSSQTKITNWDSTLTLFTYEYNVPLISPVVAAYMATAAELAFPILLVIGFATRFSAFGLFIIVCVIQFGLGPEYHLREHYYWMFLLLMLVVHGAGRFSLDRIIRKKCIGGKWQAYQKEKK